MRNGYIAVLCSQSGSLSSNHNMHSIVSVITMEFSDPLTISGEPSTDGKQCRVGLCCCVE